MKKGTLQAHNKPGMAVFPLPHHSNTPLSAQRPIATHFILHDSHEQWHYTLLDYSLLAYTIRGICFAALFMWLSVYWHIYNCLSTVNIQQFTKECNQHSDFEIYIVLW